MATPPPNQPPAWGQQPPQPGPSWGQQTAPGQPAWGPPPEPPKKSSAGKIVGLGCLGLIGVIILIGAVGASLDKKSGPTTAAPASQQAKTPAAAPTSHSPAAPATSAAPAAPTTPAAPAAPKTLLETSGSGIKNTAQFTTSDNWTLSYTYDCSSFGGTGNFIVQDEDGMPLVNELQAKGSGSSPQYSAGTHHLSVSSECKWTVRVTDGG